MIDGNKVLLIIGAGREQIKAYEIAKKLGLAIVATDINPNAPAFQLADFRLICSTRDPADTLNKVMDFSKKITIDGVITIANDVPITVAKISEALKIPGISVDSAESACNKILMKNQFIKNDVNTPPFFICRMLKKIF